MHLIMFDVDGTLVESFGFDETCYLKADDEVIGEKISVPKPILGMPPGIKRHRLR